MSRDHSYATAIHILVSLAFQGPELVTSAALARGLRTNPSLVRRVIAKLARAGLVTSTKGKGGGNRLAKPASQIDLGEIYRAVKEGPLFASFEKEPYAACPVSCNIGNVLSDAFANLEGELETKMKQIKLSKVLRELA